MHQPRSFRVMLPGAVGSALPRVVAIAPVGTDADRLLASFPMEIGSPALPRKRSQLHGLPLLRLSHTGSDGDGFSRRWADISEEEGFHCQPCEENDVQETDAAQAPALPWSTSLPSIGSFWHPVLCHKPCRFIVDGTDCPDGSGCQFCHLVHERSHGPLDKKNRETAKKLGSGFASLARPILDEKAEELGLGLGATAAIQEWSIAVVASGESEVRPNGVKPSNITRLLAQLKSMPLNIVCSVVKNNSSNPLILTHTGDLLASLRAVARACERRGGSVPPVSFQ